MAQLNCIVVTPEETALDEQADFVALPLYDGEIGISPGHSPLIGRLGFGEMRIRTGGTVQQFYVDGGFVQVNGNVISVLTNRAVPASSLDAQAAAEQLDAANKRPSNSPELADVRDRAVLQARAQLRVAKRDS
ncbi:MAG TPA: ATP synthase F1 subunit epsilon [Pirellulaceae bacterium]|nr:ATP synthase F1 subunit epsilon [Pirellulaceae bacterium]